MARGRKLAPVRAQARALVSPVWDEAVRRHSEFTRVAAILWVSERVARAWGDAEQANQIDVADVVAVHLAGGKVLAIGFLRDVLRLLEAHEGRKGWPRADHVMALSAAAGNVAAHARSQDSTDYRNALRLLDRRVQEALRDEEGGVR